jgi:hypothetical protein
MFPFNSISVLNCPVTCSFTFLIEAKIIQFQSSRSPVRGAWVQFVSTVSPRVGQLTHTLVRVHKINAGSPIFTRVYGTVIDIGLAVCARVTWQTLAGVGVQVVVAHASVLAGVGAALIDVLLALLAYNEHKMC